MPAYTPARGDLVWIDFEPNAGAEIDKRRPALVLSPQGFNASGFAFVAPVTSTERGRRRTDVHLPSGGKVAGAILLHQTRSLDWRARRAEKAEQAAPAVMAEALAKLSAILGFDT
ncbi:MAG: type II toxin-antitoxin system PemK/MazF family toxin [Bradyrhizobium sp.]|nr:MAG: type II toxin-antitoxin system PemK/MazF family toxin [Bradyrhizobium sp.]